MNPRFKSIIKSLGPKLKELVSMPPSKVGSLPKEMPSRGIYLFSEGSKHHYVGRTNRLRQRLQSHCRKSGTHSTATFAFWLARRKSGRLNPSYRTKGSRAELERDRAFKRAFKGAKVRVGKMNIRFVEECDPTKQALLEIYAAVVLKTKNDFDTH